MSDSNPPDETSNDDDPFAEFEDWLKDGPAWRWIFIWRDAGLPGDQKHIVQRNAGLLTDPDKEVWRAKVARFEAALATLVDTDAIKAKRAKYIICFDGHSFGDGEKDFSGFHFPCSVSFYRSTFGDGNVNFYGATFGDGTVSFSGATFGDGTVSFLGATFGDGTVNFSRSTFGKGDVSFAGVTFGNGTVNFFRATFVGERYVSFRGATFGKGDVSFKGATFGEGEVSFDGAVFGEGNVSFSRATFGEGELRFGGLHVKGQLNCTDLDIQRAVFRNTTVDGLADWTDAKFGSIPDFRQMRLDRTPEVARMNVPAPGMTGYWPLSTAKDQQDVLKFRKLKAMAIDANDHEKDGEFFAYEMMAKRGWETKGAFGLLANWLYWITSNYGRSYEVPFCWMVASFLGFATHYSWWLNRYVPMEDAGDFAFWFSLKNTVPFLGTLFRFVAEPENYTSQFDKAYSAAADAGLNVDALIHTWLFQGVLSLILFFFLLLGLRNRFRLK